MENLEIVGQKFIATIDDTKNDIKTIAKEFENEGVKVEKVLPFSGIITGMVDNMDSLWAKRKNLSILHLEKAKIVKAI